MEDERKFVSTNSEAENENRQKRGRSRGCCASLPVHRTRQSLTFIPWSIFFCHRRCLLKKRPHPFRVYLAPTPAASLPPVALILAAQVPGDVDGKEESTAVEKQDAGFESVTGTPIQASAPAEEPTPETPVASRPPVAPTLAAQAPGDVDGNDKPIAVEKKDDSARAEEPRSSTENNGADEVWDKKSILTTVMISR